MKTICDITFTKYRKTDYIYFDDYFLHNGIEVEVETILKYFGYQNYVVSNGQNMAYNGWLPIIWAYVNGIKFENPQLSHVNISPSPSGYTNNTSHLLPKTFMSAPLEIIEKMKNKYPEFQMEMGKIFSKWDK